MLIRHAKYSVYCTRQEMRNQREKQAAKNVLEGTLMLMERQIMTQQARAQIDFSFRQPCPRLVSAVEGGNCVDYHSWRRERKTLNKITKRRLEEAINKLSPMTQNIFFSQCEARWHRTHLELNSRPANLSRSEMFSLSAGLFHCKTASICYKILYSEMFGGLVKGKRVK